MSSHPQHAQATKRVRFTHCAHSSTPSDKCPALTRTRLPTLHPQHLYERSWYAVTKACLAMSIFRHAHSHYFMYMHTRTRTHASTHTHTQTERETHTHTGTDTHPSILYSPPHPQHLYERSWYAVTETCLAMSIFRDDFDAAFIAWFTLLLFLKIFHWLAADRVDYVSKKRLLSWFLRISLSLSLSPSLCLFHVDQTCLARSLALSL